MTQAQNRRKDATALNWAKRDASIVNVTPKQAATWLARNEKNRNPRPRVVSNLARDLTNDRWVFNGDTIKFTADGVLIDGQHRLMAICKADKAAPTVVVTGVERAAQDITDTGARRTKGDMLNMHGRKHYNQVAAAAQMAMLWEAGVFRMASGAVSEGGTDFTHLEVLEWVEANPDIEDACNCYSEWRARDIPAVPRAVMFAIWATRRIDEDAAQAFFTDLVQLNLGGKGDPKAALLRRLNYIRDFNEQASAQEIADLIFRTWNAVRAGKQIEKFSNRANTAFADPR